MDVKAAKASPKQKDILVTFMEHHPDFAKGLVIGSTERNDLWNKLTEKLNNTQGSLKNEIQWKKFYNDWKFQIRKKYARAKEHARKHKTPIPRRVDCLGNVENRLMKVLARRSSDDENEEHMQRCKRTRSSRKDRKVPVKNSISISNDTPEEDPLEQILIENVPVVLNTTTQFLEVLNNAQPSNQQIIEDTQPASTVDNTQEVHVNNSVEDKSNDMLYQINQSILKLNKTMEVIAGHLATIAKK